MHKPVQDVPTKGKIGGIPRNVFFLGLVSMFTDFSSEVAVRTLPLFLSNVLGVKTSIIGLIEGIADSTATLMRLASGWLSDKIGKRKVLVTAGYGLSSFVKPFLYLATSWHHVLVIRFLDRIGKGIRTSPRDALIADSSAKEERGKAFGFNKAMDPLGAFLGLIMASALVYFSQGALLNLSGITYRKLVILSVIPGLASFIILVAFVREAPHKVSKSKKETAGDGNISRFDANFKRYLAVMILFTLGNSSDAFLILRAQNLGMNIGQIFAMLALFNLVSSLCSYPAGRLSDTLGRKKLISLGWLVYAGVYLGFAFATDIVHIGALYLVYGIYDGLTAGVEKAFVADLVPEWMRGTAYGFFSTAVGISALPSSFLAGVLWQRLGPPAPFLFGALLSLTALLGVCRT